MKTLALILALCAAPGCSTVVYGPDDKPQMRTYANARNLTFTGPGTSLHADTLNHSTPTRAAGSIVSTLGADAVAAIVPGSGVVPVIGRAATVTSPRVFQGKAGE